MTTAKSMKDLITAALAEGCSSRPTVGPRLEGLTISDLIVITLKETFIGPRQCK